MNRWIVIALIGLVNGVAQGESFQKEIVLPARTEAELVAAPLDAEVYAGSNPHFTDLRVHDSAGAEVSFLLRRVTETRSDKVRQSWRAAQPTVDLRDDGGLEITFALEQEDPLPHGFRLVTPLADFERRVQAFSSADGKEWVPRLENGLIFDYSQMIDVANDTLTFTADEAAATHRHFRIVVDEVTQEQQSQLVELTRRLRGERETERSERSAVLRRPYRIDRIELWRDNNEERTVGPKLANYAVTLGPAEQDADTRSTRWLLTANHAPLTEVRLGTPDRNFSRTARVEVEERTGVESHWRPVGSAPVSNFDFRATQREELAIKFPETRGHTLRLVIENRDSPPLALTSITALGAAYEVVFLAAPQQKYHLAYSPAESSRPEYDIAALEAALAEKFTPTLATLGPAKTVARPAEPWLAKTLRSPQFIVLAVALVAALLGVGLYRASQRVDALPRE